MIIGIGNGVKGYPSTRELRRTTKGSESSRPRYQEGFHQEIKVLGQGAKKVFIKKVLDKDPWTLSPRDPSP